MLPGQNKKSMEKTGIYETKCRRCGVVHGWIYGDIGPLSVDEASFLEFLRDNIQYPRQSQCNVCEKDTVQDIVSYKIE